MPRNLFHFLRDRRTMQADAGGEPAPSAVPPPETTSEAPPEQSLLSGGAEQSTGATENTQPPAAEVPAFDATALTIPEGFNLPDESRSAFAAIFTDEKMTPQERGQALFDLYAKEASTLTENLTKQMATEATEAFAKIQQDWQTATRALPEFAGEKFTAEMGAVKQALVTLGADEKFFEALNVTGAGNHPAILSMLHKLTIPYREGGPVGGGSQPGPVDKARSLYPTMST